MTQNHYTWSVRELDRPHQPSCQEVASGSASCWSAAIREARHYALMYGQDGPVEVEVYNNDKLIQAWSTQ